MAYPPILVDQDGNPIPQRWNAAEGKWEPYDAILLGPDGNPISRTNPLVVAGSDGSAARAIKVDADGRPEVTLSGRIGLRPVYHFSTTLVGSAGDPYILFEHTGPIRIRKMEWLCQHEDTLLSIREKKGDGTHVAIRSMIKNGAEANHDFTPRRIAEGDSIDIFSIQKYNEFYGGGVYIFKLGLRSPMDFPCGLTISALPVSSFGSLVWRSSLLVWGTAYD